MKFRIVCMAICLALFILPAVQAEDTLEWYSKGQDALGAGKYTEAISYFDNALSLDLNYAPALSGKSVALNNLGRYSEGLGYAEKALSYRQDTAALNARAYSLYRLARYDEAVAAYDQFFLVQPNKADAYFCQGESYQALNRTGEAITAYEKAVRLEPSNIASWNNMGLAYLSLQKFEQAISAFDEGTQYTVTNATLWNNKGKAYLGLEQYQDAIQCFKKAINLDPNFSEARANIDKSMGKAQVFNITGTITPVPTISRIGTLYPGTTSIPAAISTASQTTGITGTPQGDIPPPPTTASRAVKTTYAFHSPGAALGAIVFAGLACVRLMRRQ
jgi:tetratricopeptide (TPR) repeat protein